MPSRIVRFAAHLAFIAALGSSGSAFATIVDFGSYTRDTDTGLDWLDLSATAHLSYNQVVASALVLSDGWRYATEAEVCVWFSGTCPGWETTPRIEYLSLVNPGELYGIYDAVDVAGFHPLVAQVVILEPFPYVSWSVGVDHVADDDISGHSGVGSLLVRPVPEGATAPLLAGGLLALAFGARRRRRNVHQPVYDRRAKCLRSQLDRHPERVSHR